MREDRRAMKHRARSTLIPLVLIGACAAQAPERADAPVRLTPPPWPEWVLRHWVWENEGTADSALQLVDDYLARGIPVGAVIIDRPWQTAPNTFEPDPKRYPKLGQLVQAFHERDVWVMMWITSVVNATASTYAEAKANGYFLNGGKTVRWWAGRGAFIDYTNPKAVAWWHRRMDAILDLGIDGWKCDGTDPFVVLLGRPKGAAGPITPADYRDAFYRDFFEYTRSRLGPDRVITARPCDSLPGMPISVPFAPRDVNFAGWVGDQDGSFEGLRVALANIRASSKRGYVNFGSDIGGFRGRGLRDREVMIRWAQCGALCPIMENGGGGEHRPWLYDDEVLSIYKQFATLHHELIPYLYSQGAKAWGEGASLMRFVAGGNTYLLGDALLVAALVKPGAKRRIILPAGRWRDWLNESEVHEGPGTKVLDVPLSRFPVFVREGAIVPLDVSDATTGHGDAFCRNHLTVAAYPIAGEARSFDLYEERGTGAQLSWRAEDRALTLESSPIRRKLTWRVPGLRDVERITESSGPDPVRVDSTQALLTAPRTWTVDRDGILWVRIANADQGMRVRIQR